jgi:5,10-methylenetetrahydromethanopterin reductase
VYQLGLKLDFVSAQETVELAQWADDNDFSTVWIGEGGLTASAIPPLTLMAYSTKRIRIGSGILPYRTRNVALLALEFRTLDAIAPGRMIMGLGAWWEPIASRVGLANSRPVAAMREVVTVATRLLAGESVTQQGEFVRVDDIRLDALPNGDTSAPVPVYIGGVRSGMLALAGEVADGVVLNFLVPPSYTEKAMDDIASGASKRARDLTGFATPQLIATSIDDVDPDDAIDECAAFLTRNLAQPHVAEFSGADPELVTKISSIAGWPSSAASIREAMRHVPRALVQSVCACGTTAQALDAIGAYLDAGATEAAIAPLGTDKNRTLRRLAPYASAANGSSREDF